MTPHGRWNRLFSVRRAALKYTGGSYVDESDGPRRRATSPSNRQSVMESRSGSIKDPIYYPENEAAAAAPSPGPSGSDIDKSQRSSLGSQQEVGSLQEDGGNAAANLKVPRKFITNWRQACDRTRDRTKDLLKRWRTTASNVDELAAAPSVVPTEALEQPGWSVHVWSE